MADDRGVARATRVAGVPPELARVPFGVVRPVDARGVYAHPRPQFARLAARGLLHVLAPGYFALVPPAQVGRGFRPSVEAAGFGIAAAAFGADRVLLMGVSAARMHGALPRALPVAVVAVPVQRRVLRLADRDGEVRFVRRDTGRLEAERMSTDLGWALVGTVEQTVLDLAHRPQLGGVPGQAREAAIALLARCDRRGLEELAAGQRLRAALDRAHEWAGG